MNEQLTLADEFVLSKIYVIREQKVMLDKDLAALYGVETKVFNQAVKRNINRFPEDFMFTLTKNEHEILRSQIVTSSWGGARYLPNVFTEQGIAMLASVLSSEKAININIQIVRVFTRMRKMLADNTDVRLILEEIRRKTENNTKNIEVVFKYLDELIEKQETPVERIVISGYKSNRN